MTLVVDASAVVAALVDGGPDGTWAENVLVSDHLAAPHLLRAEVANILRRAALAREISDDTASLAHADLLALRDEAPDGARGSERRYPSPESREWVGTAVHVMHIFSTRRLRRVRVRLT